jgi:RsmE family RNA methyltransferase
MNLLLLRPDEVQGGMAILTDRRLAHARDVLRTALGDALVVGLRGGRRGTATVVEQTPTSISLRCEFGMAPPPRPGVDLIVAIPRPKALKRVIPAVASLGVDRLVLVNAARVEKSYFDAKVLTAQTLEHLVDLGLEQAKDTISPRIEIRERLKPFVEDESSTFFPPTALRFVPHPMATEVARPMPSNQRLVIALGPDGGWVPYEVDLFARHGFMPIQLGQRVLRGEVAVPAAICALRPGLVYEEGQSDAEPQ